jgi:general secretion pathway protein M|tara:strand:- start:3281 stop:3787 length:507 start_codon:yes stop_codon:yes gene_type:complete
MEFLKKNAVLIKLRESYAQLALRDQVALKVLALFFVVLICVFGMWQPLQAFVDDSQALRDSNRDLIQLMRDTEKQARSISGISRSNRNSGQSLLILVSRSAKSANIALDKLQPEGTDSVSVWFEDVSFNDMMRWLEKLEADESVHVHQISVNRLQKSGSVSARLVLKT